MIWNHIIIDIVDFTHKEISIYCLMSFQVLKKRNCVKVSLIFIPLNGHWMKTNEINNGRMHVANKINWIGIEDPETLNTINLHKSSVICAVITYYNKTTNIYCFTGKTLLQVICLHWAINRLNVTVLRILHNWQRISTQDGWLKI